MITYRISFQQLHCLNHYENMTFYMSTSSKKSEQWREILGENIKLENEGDKMRAHAGEGRLCPSSLSTLPIAFAIPANRRIFHPLHKYLEQDLEPSVSYLDSGCVCALMWVLRRANVVMCVWGWGPGTQGREQYWVNLVQKKRRTLKDWVSCSPTKTSRDMGMLPKLWN